MSNWMFMGLFPEERDLAERVITEVREREGLTDEKAFTYQERFGNLYETLKHIREDHPERVKEVLDEITSNYDGFVDQAIIDFPLTADTYWQNYRRNQTKRSILDDVPLEDSKLAESYKESLTWMMADEGRISLDVEPQFHLLDRQPERALGVGVYIFKNEEGRPIESIWDLTAKEIPKFQYEGGE